MECSFLNVGYHILIIYPQGVLKQACFETLKIYAFRVSFVSFTPVPRFPTVTLSHETRSASAGLFSCMRLLDLVLRISSNAGYIRMFGVAKSRAEVHFEHDCAKKHSAILPSQQGSAIFEYISKTGSYDPVLSVTSSF